VSAVLAGGAGAGYEAPTVGDMWQPLVGDGAMAFTRASLEMVLSGVLLIGLLLWATRSLVVVPSRRQLAIEYVYGMVRNSVAKEIIGSRDFLRYTPLLFTMFVLILLNNLFGVLPPVQNPTMGRVAFPTVLALVVFVLYHVCGATSRVSRHPGCRPSSCRCCIHLS
jgi:F-type H+-transporting ATPase subunit a